MDSTEHPDQTEPAVSEPHAGAETEATAAPPEADDPYLKDQLESIRAIGERGSSSR